MKLTIQADFFVNFDGEQDEFQAQLAEEGLDNDEITRKTLEKELKDNGLHDLGLHYEILDLYVPGGRASFIEVVGDYDSILEFFGNVYGLEKEELDRGIKQIKETGQADYFEGYELVKISE